VDHGNLTISDDPPPFLLPSPVPEGILILFLLRVPPRTRRVTKRMETEKVTETMMKKTMMMKEAEMGVKAKKTLKETWKKVTMMTVKINRERAEGYERKLKSHKLPKRENEGGPERTRCNV
jgi:hypothetical protein